MDILMIGVPLDDVIPATHAIKAFLRDCDEEVVPRHRCWIVTANTVTREAQTEMLTHATRDFAIWRSLRQVTVKLVYPA